MTPHIGRVLGGFHHRVARRVMGRNIKQERDGIWLYPPPEVAMAEATLHYVKTYAYRRQNIVAQFIATRFIMDLCLAALQRSGSRITKW